VPITAGDGPEALADGVFLAAVAVMAAIPSSLGAERKKAAFGGGRLPCKG
jgi:hypothetical protein